LTTRWATRGQREIRKQPQLPPSLKRQKPPISGRNAEQPWRAATLGANKEFALLRALAAEPTRVFSKQELLRDVWDFRSLGRTRTLDSHASRLRRKLDPEAARFVLNVWGVPQRHLFGPVPVRGSSRAGTKQAL
jgi:DNA-binding response OmpR family regulator